MDDVDFDQLEAVLEGQQRPPHNTGAQQAVTDGTQRGFAEYKNGKEGSAAGDGSTHLSARGPRDEEGTSQHERRRSGSFSRCNSEVDGASQKYDGSRHERRQRSGSLRRRSGRSRSRSSQRRRHDARRRSGSPGSQERYSRRRRPVDRDGSARHSERSSTRSPHDGNSSRRRPRASEEDPHEARVKDDLRRKQEEERRLKEEEEKRRREIDEARRDDLTVLILNLSLKATERDVWKFFSEKAGKVRDIQVIRDSRSGKSKGVGYVEFYAPQAVLQALALSGSYIMDIPIIVQASQAEKNRAAKAAKQQAAEITEGGPMKVYVGGLTDSLSSLSESDLKQLFSPFGEIVGVDLHKDPYTGRSKGYGFIQFRNAQDAREAMAAMNGFEIGGKQLKVGYATDPGQRPMAPLTSADSVHGVPLGSNLAAAQTALQTALMYAETQTDNERLDDEGGGLLSGVNPRISLMQKLQRIEPTSATPSITGPLGTLAPGASIGALPRIIPNPVGTTVLAPTSAGFGMPGVLSGAIPGVPNAAVPSAGSPIFSCNICLEPVYTETEVRQEEPGFLDEIVEDVRGECSKYGVVMQAWTDRKNLDGKLWIKFGGPDQAVKAHHALNGRFFAGKRITVTFVTDAQWAMTCTTGTAGQA